MTDYRVNAILAALGPPQQPQEPGEQATGARDVELALPQAWKDFIRRHSVDGETEPIRAAAMQVGGRVQIVVNLETLLGIEPTPTPGLVPGPSKAIPATKVSLAGSNYPLRAQLPFTWAAGHPTGYARMVVTAVSLDDKASTWFQRGEDAFIAITFGFSNAGRDSVGQARISDPQVGASAEDGPIDFATYGVTPWVSIVQTADMDWSAAAWKSSGVPSEKGQVGVIGFVETLIPASSLEVGKNDLHTSPLPHDLEASGPRPLPKTGPRARDARGRFSRQIEE